MKQYLVCNGGQFYVPRQPDQVMLSVTPGRYEILDVEMCSGYDQFRYVCRRSAEGLTARYPGMFRIERSDV